MNSRFIFNQLCALLMVLSIVLLVLELSFFGLSYFGEREADLPARVSLILTGAAGLILGFFGWWGSRSEDRRLGRRDALLLVALTWLLGAGFAALPFFIWARASHRGDALHVFENFINCYFEAMSGLTTTGASVLADVESIPPSLLLWRAFTQWLGGLGIVVLFVAVLPTLGVGARKLYRFEAPGPVHEGVRPNIRDTARSLWYIYLGLTVVEVLALLAAGLNIFDAVCHTFSTVSSGGFSTRNASIGAYGTAPILIVTLFMGLAGVNFALFYQVLHGKWRSMLRDPELRVYLVMLVAGSAIIMTALLLADDPIHRTTGEELPRTLGVAAREGIFTAVSLQTTTGFATSDFNLWPFAAQAALVLMMFVGGSGGSTAGGIKVVRIWIAFRVMLGEIERAFRPNVVRPMRLGGSIMDAEVKLGVLAYILGIVLLFLAGAGAVMLFETWFNPDVVTDFRTGSTASVACLCNIGPGIGLVGPVANYGWMTDASKITLSILMVVGRIEVFAILVLFSPSFWRGD